MVVSAALYLPFIFKNTGQPAYIVTRVKECEVRIYQAITIGTAMQSLIEIFLVQWESQLGLYSRENLAHTIIRSLPDLIGHYPNILNP